MPRSRVLCTKTQVGVVQPHEPFTQQSLMQVYLEVTGTKDYVVITLPLPNIIFHSTITTRQEELKQTNREGPKGPKLSLPHTH